MAGIVINDVGIVVPGQITRKFDGANTTLTVTEEQARSLNESTSTVLAFFDAQKPGADAEYAPKK